MGYKPPSEWKTFKPTELGLNQNLNLPLKIPKPQGCYSCLLCVGALVALSSGAQVPLPGGQPLCTISQVSEHSQVAGVYTDTCLAVLG